MSIRAETSFSLNDQLFNAATVRLFSDHLQRAEKQFPANAYRKQVLAQFPALTLKERINYMVTALADYLPEDFPQAVSLLQRALPEPLDPGKTDNDFGQYIWIVPGEYVARHGCQPAHLQRSLTFLGEATTRFSAEAAIRPFLAKHRKQTMAFVKRWARHDNYHVRRLASEGIRPFLPWASRANVPVSEIIPILDQLFQDPTRYVIRSVANTLNDIAKMEPETVVSTLGRWQARHSSSELAWLSKHALRTLLKADHPSAMALLGYTENPEFSVAKLHTSKQVRVGEQFNWQCAITSAAEQKLKINLHIHFLKANGNHAAKVFAVKDAQFQAGETLLVDKKQLFKPMTTRVLYPGTHYAELTVNGQSAGKRKFELVV